MLVRTQQNTRRLLATFARSAISVMLIVLIVWWLGGFGKIGAIVAHISLGLAVLVLAVSMLDRALMTLKWVWLLKSRGIYFRFLPAMRIYCASMIWGMFLPATVGADSIRAVSTSRAGVNTNEVVASIVIERMIGFLSGLLVGLCSLLLLSITWSLPSRLVPVWWAALLLSTFAFVAVAASFSDDVFQLIHHHLLGPFRNNRLVDKLRNFHVAYLAYRKTPKSLVMFSVLTIAEQLIPIVQSWLVALSLGIHAGILAFMVAVPLSALVSRVPIGLGGLGTFEAAFALLLSLAGITGTEAIAIAFSGRILQILSWLPWWFAHVVSRGNIGPGAGKLYPQTSAAEATSSL
jgi:glycosyltransferase 2 family protein